MLDYLCVIQARLYSTRLPGKCLMDVGGRPMVKRVWDASKEALKGRNAKVIVAWPERYYPDLDESNVLGRFRFLSSEFPSRTIVRLTSDCPLLTPEDILRALHMFESNRDCARFPMYKYYSNHQDGKDVQIFSSDLLHNKHFSHKEHVIRDFNTESTGLSVNTKEDLERVRALVNVD